MNKTKPLNYIIIIVIFVLLLGITILKYHSKKVENETLWQAEATDKFDKNAIINSGYPSLIDIGRSDCYSCSTMYNTLISLNKSNQNNIIIKIVNFAKYHDLTTQFDFKVIPTQFFYDKDGSLYLKHEGSMSKEEIILTFKEMGYELYE